MSQATLTSEPFTNSNLFSGYYLDERVDSLDPWDCDDEAAEAFDDLQRLWDLERDLVGSYKEDELLDTWIDEVLDVLGFSPLSETTLPDSGGYNDRLLFESGSDRRDAALQKKDGNVEGMYGSAAAVLEAKQWDADFTKRFSEHRSYRDASHQVKYYLEHTPENLEWGILTDGRKWRLYGTKDYATETYYEVDLPELLDSGDLEAFKYFYAFFRPEAFREIAGETFLDTVWSESETAAQELGEDLQDNVFTALRVLGEGFVETNDLDIDPDDDATLDELKEQSLVLLYRLMFVLYAESRGLIHPDDPDASDEYDEHFSLDQLRLEIHEDVDGGDSLDDYSEHATSMWSRLEDLFRLVDAGEESLGIPPYNGGLFDDEEHAFLAENQVADRYIAEVVYRLGTTESDDGSFVLADYADLDTRHLGSIYEGLLEHEFRIAPEQYAAVAEDGGQVWKPATDVSVADAVESVETGELYVVNDEGERKATGAYYTPDYVVSYIVEETVDPLLEDIDEELRADGLEPSDREYFQRFWQRVLGLKILDPAMGSGHFLTKATGYLTERVMEVVREQEIQSYDEQELRRDIAKECIYGVDVNGMAVELAKLSMWLETLATDKPLAFLDHHLKTGNSLVGSDITEVLSNGEEDDGQLTLVQAFARVRKDTLDHVMDLMQDLLAIDNNELEDIKSMEEVYDEIRDDPLYQRLFELANVHTAEQFGVDVDDGAYEDMAGAIEDADEWAEIRNEPWFTEAQELAAGETFFHWELEYPEVFFDAKGETRKDAGFDAVVGNPPWMRFQRIPDSQRSYQRERYQSAEGKYDIYGPFIESSLSHIRKDGLLGFIVQNRFLSADYGTSLREIIVNNSNIRSLLDFENAPIFSGTTTYPLITVLEKSDRTEFRYIHLQDANRKEVQQALESINETDNTIDIEELDPEDTWIFPSADEREVIEKIQESADTTFGEIVEISKSVSTNFKEAFLFDKNDETPSVEPELLTPAVDGKDIEEYSDPNVGKSLLFPYRWTDDGPKLVDISEYTEAEKHLKRFEEELRGRRYYNKSLKEAGLKWYEYPHVKENHDKPKILFPDISTKPRCTYDRDGNILTLTTAYGGVRKSRHIDVRYLCAIFNSAPVSMVFEQTSPQMSGGYYRYQPQYIGDLPLALPDIEIREIDSENDIELDKLGGFSDMSEKSLYKTIVTAASKRRDLHTENRDINSSLLDHVGAYSEGQTLANVGLTQPPKDSADSILQQTAEQKPNLRVGKALVERESENTVTINLTARFKPDDEDSETRPKGGSRTAGTGAARGGAHETDQWGYTETDPLPALRITDLTETETDLIEAFVPVAVDEAGGFAGFRETATKTNSLVDRLRALTLPRVADVREGLASYQETMARAEELETKIERTDDLIDEIVYELYGLTDEEIEIVEEAVGE